MKKIFIFLLLISQIAFSQNQTSWGVQGNRPNNSIFLGTTNSQPLVFKVNNVEVFKLTGTTATFFGTKKPIFTVNGTVPDASGNIAISGGEPLIALGTTAQYWRGDKTWVDFPKLFSGNYKDLTNKPTIRAVPTDISAFTNDVGYLTTNTVTSVTAPLSLTAGNISISTGTNRQVLATSGTGVVWQTIAGATPYTAGDGIIIDGSNVVSINAWVYFVQQWSVVPTVIATITGVPAGDVWNYTLKGVTRFRFVPTNYAPTLDAFYSSWNSSTSTLSGLIATRG